MLVCPNVPLDNPTLVVFCGTWGQRLDADIDSEITAGGIRDMGQR